MMTNEATVNLNMFSTFMEDIIMSNLNSTWIIKVILVVVEQSTPRSCSNQYNQMSLTVVAANALYSASSME